MTVDLDDLGRMFSHVRVAERYARTLDASALARLRMPEIRALGMLEQGFAALGRTVVERRRSLFRDYVGATVTGISPLLVRWCALEDADVDGLAGLLGPDRSWTPWLCGPRPLDPASAMKWQTPRFKPTRREAVFHELQHFAHSGVVVRRKSTGNGFGIRVLHDRLEMAAFLGEARVRTFGVGGALTITEHLPEIVAAALPGRPLDKLVAHPLLDGAGCVVTRVDGPTFWGTKIHFRLAPQWWRLPWARNESGDAIGANEAGRAVGVDATSRPLARPANGALDAGVRGEQP